jgi:hypothetical protein
LLDPVEEALDPIAVAVEIGLKLIGLLRSRFDGILAQTPRLIA